MSLRIQATHSEPETAELVETPFPLILPHELFGALYRAGKDRWTTSILGGDEQSLSSFWQHMLQHARWTDDHPLREGFVAGNVVPCGLYGDGAKVTREDSLLTLTWNSVVTSSMKPSFECRMLICACPTTWLPDVDQITGVIVWSFGCMADGFFPHRDHLGNEWAPGSERAFKAGLPLAPGYKACLCQFRGDWEWFAKAVHIGTATSGNPCFKCQCTPQGPLTWTNFTDEAPWRSTSRGVPVGPLTRLHFHLQQLRPDLMHTVCLGVGLWVNAAVLLHLAEAKHFGEGTLAGQLAQAWLRFHNWVHDMRLGRSSQRMFTVRRVQQSCEYAELLAKAWNSRLVSNWLASEMQRAPLVTEDDHLTATLVWAVNEAFHVGEAHGRFLTRGAADHYKATVDLALRVYRELSFRCLRRRVLRYPMRPKLHLWAELASTVQEDLCNPRHYHCFADEDFLRTVLRTARATPRANMAAATVRRYLVRLALTWAGRARPRLRAVRPATKRRPWKLRCRL